MADAQKERRHRGRPRVNERMSAVSTWLRRDDHDKLVLIALKRDTSVSKLVKQFLEAHLSR